VLFVKYRRTHGGIIPHGGATFKRF
jgi:hypothetical protein